MGTVAKSYMRKGFFIYKEMRIFLGLYEEAVSHIWLCNRSLLDFFICEENFVFFFISVDDIRLFSMFLFGFRHKQHKLGWANHTQVDEYVSFLLIFQFKKAWEKLNL